MKKKIISYVLIMSLLISGIYQINMFSSISYGKSKKSEYIVQTDSIGIYKELEKSLLKEEQEHQNGDEYLSQENILKINLSKDEAEKLEQEKDVIVERNYSVYASEYSKKAIISKKCYDEEIETTVDPEKFKYGQSINAKKNRSKEVIPWNIELVAGTPHKNKHKGKNVKVAIIDSGIDLHDEIVVKKWVDFTEDEKGYKPIDNSGHGTTVAGIIGAQKNGIGIEGIASRAEIYSLKVLNQDNRADVGTIIKALEWCIDNKIDVINMSFGLNNYSEILENTIKRAANANIIMIAAAGNDGKTIQYPAKYSEVISVGSVDEQLQSSEFSYNKGADVVAPGENTQTTGYLGSYCNVDGTSIACAHVTGIVSLAKSANKNISLQGMKMLLDETSIDLGENGKLVNYGAIINHINEKDYTVNKKSLYTLINNSLKSDDSVVEGAWSYNTWKGVNTSEGTGHYSMVNNIPLSYFGESTESTTVKVKHRNIAAAAVQYADTLDWLSATSDLGNGSRNADGRLGSTYVINGMPSPYHAKASYTVNEVVEHIFFLYELARRRISLKWNFDLNPTNYSGDFYYGNYIKERLKRRIIVDLGAVRDHTQISYGYDLSSAVDNGYMILGVFLHLVQDFQAHRAKVTPEMLYSKADGTQYHGYDYFTSSAAASRINASNVIGMSNSNYDQYWKLYEKVKSGKLSMNKLKTYLVNSITINCNGTTYTCTPNQAYEDNPFFFSDRFSTALSFSKAYIADMLKDRSTSSTGLEYYYADDKVKLC